MKSRAELLRSAFLGPDLEIGVPWDELKQPVRDRWEAALKAVQRVPTKVKVRWTVTAEDAAKMMQHIKAGICDAYSAWDDLGENYKEDFIKTFEKLLPRLAAHAVIDVPAGVPSVEELDSIANDAWEDAAAKTTNNRERQHAMLSAIRDRILAGLAAETTTGAVLASEDEVEALARVLHDAYAISRHNEGLGEPRLWADIEPSLKAARINQARAAIAHMRKRPEGLPTREQAEAKWEEVDRTPSHRGDKWRAFYDWILPLLPETATQPEIPNGLPTREELVVMVDDACRDGGDSRHIADAILAALTPYLRDPVGKPELDVTAEEYADWKLQLEGE